MHTVTVTIKPDGTTTVSVDGMKGMSCTDVTRAVEKALGTVSSDAKKPEYHQQGNAAQQVNQGSK